MIDARKIETLSVGYLKNVIVRCNHLQPYFDSNDKTPSYDGTIQISKSEGGKKDLAGIVHVQIKGKQLEKLPSGNRTFNVDVSDLRNYQGTGVMFFVVYIDCNDNCKIYYETLTPVKIKLYLDNTPDEQKTKSIKLRPLPVNLFEIETIIGNFCEDTRKQISCPPQKMFTIDNLKNNKGITGITFSTLWYGGEKNNVTQHLFNNEIYLYAKIKDSPIPIPIANLIKNIRYGGVVNENVTINDKVYYDKYTVNIENRDIMQICIGESFIYNVNTKCGNNKLNYTSTNYLKERLHDISFLCDLIEYKTFSIGKFVINATSDYSKIDLTSIKNEKKRLERLDALMAKLNVSEKVDVTKIEDYQWKHVVLLEHAILDKELVSLKKIEAEKIPVLTNLQIGSINLKVIISQPNANEKLYKFEDCFHCDSFYYGYKIDDDKYIAIPPAAILSVEEFNSVSNIDYSDIISSFKFYSANQPELLEYANLTMLNMLLAYDESSKEQLLKSSKGLANWLMETYKSEQDKMIGMINCFQIAKRERILTDNEKNDLYGIIENPNSNMMFKIAAYLLLDNTTKAREHYNRLNNEDKQLFDTYPLNRFWNNK